MVSEQHEKGALRTRIARLVCRIRGHDWQQRPVKRVTDPDATIGVCDRCGDTLEGWEALSVGGRDVPTELLDQDDVDKLKAMYRDGEISQARFEKALRLALGDETALAEIEEVVEHE